MEDIEDHTRRRDAHRKVNVFPSLPPRTAKPKPQRMGCLYNVFRGPVKPYYSVELPLIGHYRAAAGKRFAASLLKAGVGFVLVASLAGGTIVDADGNTE